MLSRQVLNKTKQQGKSSSAILTAVFLIITFSATAQDVAVNAAAAPANYGGLSANMFYFFAAVLGTEIAAILFLALTIRSMYNELLPAKTVAKSNAFKAWWNNLDKKLFTKAVPVEKEADVLLDHDYDGIQELDNALPPWWKYGFYITIVVAFVYIAHFHVFASGKNPLQEYNAEMDKAKIEKKRTKHKIKTRLMKPMCQWLMLPVLVLLKYFLMKNVKPAMVVPAKVVPDQT
ncbi:MAG: hypothetical protein HC846_05640 [Blastocatellia bacterium]|nr:hypothetical protein [Blastocatellia bacterium]